MLFQKIGVASIVLLSLMVAPAYGAIYYVGLDRGNSGNNYNDTFFQIECQGCLIQATTEWLGREWQAFVGPTSLSNTFFSNPPDTGRDNFGYFVTGQGSWRRYPTTPGFSSYSLSYLGTYAGAPVPWIITGDQGSTNGDGLMTVIIRNLFPEVTDFEGIGWYDLSATTPTCNPFIQKNGNWIVELPKNAKIALCTRQRGTSIMVSSSLMINDFQPFAVMRQWGQEQSYPTISGLPPGGGPIVLPPPGGGGGGGTPPTSPIPEPGSGLLAGLGAVVIAVSWAYGLRRAALKK